MNIFIKHSQTGEVKQFKNGLLLKNFVQTIASKKISCSDSAIQFLKEDSENWKVAYQQKEKFNLC